MIHFKKYFLALVAFSFFVGCGEKSSDTLGDQGGDLIEKVALDVNIEVSKSVMDFDKLKSSGFYLFVDQNGLENDQYVKMKYSAERAKWLPYTVDGEVAITELYWENVAAADNRVVALFSGQDITQAQFMAQSSFALAANQSTVDLVDKQDWLYGATDDEVTSGVYSATVDGSTGVVNINFRHLMSMIYISTPCASGFTVEGVTLYGLKNGLDANFSLSGSYTATSAAESLESSALGLNSYQVTVPAQDAEFYVKIKVNNGTSLQEFTSEKFTYTFESSKGYELELPISGEVYDGFIVGLGGSWDIYESPYSDIDGSAQLQKELVISTPQQLVDFASQSIGHYEGESANDFAGYNITLASNIDMSGIEGFVGVGTFAIPFKGTFDGKGYTISNLVMRNFDFYQGLFTSVGREAIVTNVKVKNFTIGSEDCHEEHYYGSLIATNAGLVYDCSADGCTVIAADKVGGLIGHNKGNVYNCSATNCTVKALDSDGVSGNIIGLDE